jgi:intein-encoded DNA endonuclease-like protein
LSEKDKYNCDGEITVTECSDAVNEMKWNISPGLDGFSVEFYRNFWDKLKYFLIKTYNKCTVYVNCPPILHAFTFKINN